LRVLGAILAGGQARRFGSDKAHALYKGTRLIDHVAASLGAQCERLIVVGRNEADFTCIPDRPEPGLGPLGGLNAALHYAQDNGIDQVLSAGVDIPDAVGAPLPVTAPRLSRHNRSSGCGPHPWRQFWHPIWPMEDARCMALPKG